MKSNDIYDIDESNLGLPLVNLPYEEQLKIKKETVIKLLKGLISPKTKINDCIGMDNPTHYRNKVHVVLGLDRNKKIITGMYQENSHKIIPITSSLIHDTKADEIIQSIKEIISKQKLSIYDEDKNSGLLRHILIRRAKKTDQTMVVIVTSSEIFPGRNNFVKELRKKHPEITTIVQNINSRKTSIILGDKERVLYGKGYITDILCGLKFNISSKSFYQVNSIQTEVLYHKAIEYAHLTGKETVLDAYCGIGTISLIASQKAKEVIGVEVNRSAVIDAINNAKINKISNAYFYCSDVVDFIKDLNEINTVFLDPPRIGCDDRFLKSLTNLKPQKIIYISCNPESLARDLKILNKNYHIIEVQPIDMFPHTAHVEYIVLMSRLKASRLLPIAGSVPPLQNKCPTLILVKTYSEITLQID